MATGINDTTLPNSKGTPFGMGTPKKSFTYSATPSQGVQKLQGTTPVQRPVEEKPINIPDFLKNR